MKVGFFPNMNKKNIVSILRETLALCEREKMEVFFPNDLDIPKDWDDDEKMESPCITDLYDELGITTARVKSRIDLFEQIDLAFSFGGDGTIIHLARQIYPYQVPICGINLGELGFLNQIELEQLEDRIKQIASYDYDIEKRVHLQAHIVGDDGNKELIPIMNDIVITHPKPGKMARIILSINGRKTQTYPCDGIIVSTPTGSTGYNLSTGGPIMGPDHHSLIISPIAPHLLQSVSLVLKENSSIDLTMPDREPFLHISVDGTFDYTFTNQETLHICANPTYCKYIRFRDRQFFGTLFNKLSARREQL